MLAAFPWCSGDSGDVFLALWDQAWELELDLGLLQCTEMTYGPWNTLFFTSLCVHGVGECIFACSYVCRCTIVHAHMCMWRHKVDNRNSNPSIALLCIFWVRVSQDGTRNLVIDNPTLSGQLVLGSPFFVFWGWTHRWISTHAVLGTWTWLSCVYFQHSHHWVVSSEPQSQFELKVPAWQMGVTVSFSMLLEAQDSELSRREGITERLKRALKIKSLYDRLRKSVLSGNSGRLQLKVYSFFS